MTPQAGVGNASRMSSRISHRLRRRRNQRSNAELCSATRRGTPDSDPRFNTTTGDQGHDALVRHQPTVLGVPGARLLRRDERSPAGPAQVPQALPGACPAQWSRRVSRTSGSTSVDKHGPSPGSTSTNRAEPPAFSLMGQASRQFGHIAGHHPPTRPRWGPPPRCTRIPMIALPNPRKDATGDRPQAAASSRTPPPTTSCSPHHTPYHVMINSGTYHKSITASPYAHPPRTPDIPAIVPGRFRTFDSSGGLYCNERSGSARPRVLRRQAVGGRQIVHMVSGAGTCRSIR